MNGLTYLLQTNLYLLLFMGFYVLVLRNETFFRQNRFFLNTSIFLSFLIPFINSSWFRDLFITQKVRETAIMPTQMMYDTIIVGANEEASLMTLGDTLFWIYTLGAAILLTRFFVRLIFLRSSLKAEKGSAFSFFNTMVVDSEMPEASTIIDHEKVHMRQWHSADIIFVEMAAIVNWFNPVMYLYKKEIRHIHEFIADEEASKLMQSKSDYALLLFSNTLGVDPLHLSNNFFNKSLLKRRITMLHKTKSSRTGLWKYGFSAPLFMLMLVVSAAAASSEENVLSINSDKSLPELTEKLVEIIKEPTTSTTTVPSDDRSLDITTLNKHLMKNLRYPNSARRNKTMGFIVVNYKVKSGRMTDVKIAKGLTGDINSEVLRALALYDEPLQIPDNNYSTTILFKLSGETLRSTSKPKPSKGHISAGQVTVVAMAYDGAEAFSKANKTDTIKGFASVDVLPEFPGGMKGWGEYLQSNLKYPAEAKKNNLTGRVILSFIVEKDGNLSDIKVLRGVGGGLDEEAVRVLATSPKWKPGLLKGRPVRVAYTMPIFFQPGQNTGPSTAQTPIRQPSPQQGVLDFAAVDVLPNFAGGMTGWGQYLAANLKYPEQAKKEKITGRVILSFIVEKDGNLSDIKVLRGIGGGADEEAVRVVAASPAWKPGMMDGRPVRVAYTMPVFFQLGSANDK